MLAVFVIMMVAGFAAVVVASQWAVRAAADLAATTQLPPFFVGVTLLAIGTDLPEIANSIAASVTDHGDVNLGDSVGSAATQATLVLGLLPLIGGVMSVPRRGLIPTVGFTVVALLALLAFVNDGNLGRLDALVLIVFWILASRVVYRQTIEEQQLTIAEPAAGRLRLVLRTVFALVGVAASAMLALWGIVGIAEELDAPELLVSFFVASIGTSLPELAFDLTAFRRGQVAMAIGNVFGSSFLDATVSIAAGPLIAPTDISRDLAIEVIVASAVAVTLVGLLMSRIERHDWRTGVILLGIYAGFFVVLL